MPLINLTKATLTKWVAYGPCVIRGFHGTNNQGADLYIQFHQVVPNTVAGELTADTVPECKSFLAQSNNAFDYISENIPLSECVIAISTDPVKYVAPAADGGLDWTVDVDTVFTVNSTFVIQGDLTTQVSTLALWSESDGALAPKRLLRLDCVETADLNAGQFILLTTDDGASSGKYIAFCTGLPLNTTSTFFFGPNYRPRAGGKLGCKVVRSSENAIPAGGSDQMAIRAIVDVVLQ